MTFSTFLAAAFLAGDFFFAAIINPYFVFGIVLGTVLVVVVVVFLGTVEEVLDVLVGTVDEVVVVVLFLGVVVVVVLGLVVDGLATLLEVRVGGFAFGPFF